MVEYLYAAYSLGGTRYRPGDAGTRFAAGARASSRSPREEMGHLLTVQNLLCLLGGPPSFDREDYPWTARTTPSRSASSRFPSTRSPATSTRRWSPTCLPLCRARARRGSTSSSTTARRSRRSSRTACGRRAGASLITSARSTTPSTPSWRTRTSFPTPASMRTPTRCRRPGTSGDRAYRPAADDEDKPILTRQPNVIVVQMAQSYRGDRRSRGNRRAGRDSAPARAAGERPLAFRQLRGDLPGVRGGRGPSRPCVPGPREPVHARPRRTGAEPAPTSRSATRRAPGRTSSTSATACCSPTSRIPTACHGRTGTPGARAPMLAARLRRDVQRQGDRRDTRPPAARTMPRRRRGAGRPIRDAVHHGAAAGRPGLLAAAIAICSRPRASLSEELLSEAPSVEGGDYLLALRDLDLGRSRGSTRCSPARVAGGRRRMTIQSLRILPAACDRRLGSAPRAARQLHDRDRPEDPLGFRRIVPAETLVVDDATGEISRSWVPTAIAFKARRAIRPVAPVPRGVRARPRPDTLEPLTIELLEREGLGPDRRSAGR